MNAILPSEYEALDPLTHDYEKTHYIVKTKMGQLFWTWPNAGKYQVMKRDFSFHPEQLEFVVKMDITDFWKVTRNDR